MAVSNPAPITVHDCTCHPVILHTPSFYIGSEKFLRASILTLTGVTVGALADDSSFPLTSFFNDEMDILGSFGVSVFAV